MQEGRTALVLITALAVTAAAGALCTAASATFPGADGRIAFVRTIPPSSSQIHAVDPDGSNDVELTNVGSQNSFPSYSGDGERLAFASNRASGPLSIFTMDADGQAQAPVGVPGAFLGFSPDGRRITFARLVGASREVFVVDADGQNEIQLTNAPGDDFEPSFSPDGNRILFESNRDGNAEIYVMDADGQNQTRLTTSPQPDEDPSYSPDAQIIAFERFDGGDEEIFVVDANGQNPMPLTDNAVGDFDPAFSPSGQRIAFVRNDGSDTELFVADSSGQNPVALTNNAVADFNPDWQPLNPPACDLTGERQRSFRSVTVTVTCANENASVTAGGSGKAPKVRSAVPSKAKRFTLAPITAQVAANQVTTLALEVPKKGRKALKRAAKAGKKGKVVVTMTATDDLGQVSEDQQKLKFRAKPKKVGRG